jgi:guanylate kinase
MNNFIIIAICGKSASGKSTIADKLQFELCELGYDAHFIVSASSRPRRENEIDGIDYHFLPKEKFFQENKYCEYTEFNGWYYGTPWSEIHEGINVGVFNPSGLRQLIDTVGVEKVVPIYLKCSAIERTKRSRMREGKITFEMLRRIIVDFFDFKKIDRLLYVFYDSYCIDSKQYPFWFIVKQIICFLRFERIIPRFPN